MIPGCLGADILIILLQHWKEIFSQCKAHKININAM